MPSRPADPRRLRLLGIALLILGVGHVPLPRADFHNIRHHDGPGEACGLHEHLLRWHPDAGAADDVALLHWHWAPPDAPQGSDHGSLARLTAPDWMGMAPDEAPRWAPTPAPRLIDRPDAPTAPLASLLPLVEAQHSWASMQAGPRPVHAFGATFAPRISRNALLQLWTC